LKEFKGKRKDKSEKLEPENENRKVRLPEILHASLKTEIEEAKWKKV